MVVNNFFLVGMVSALVAWWGVIPALNYTRGTSENISVSVLAEPFMESDELVYKWEGEIVRLCPIDIRRSIVDSEGAVTHLVEASYGKPSSKLLGVQTYESSVRVPTDIPEGPAVYRAVEVPRCNLLQIIRPVEVPYPDVHFTVTR